MSGSGGTVHFFRDAAGASRSYHGLVVILGVRFQAVPEVIRHHRTKRSPRSVGRSVGRVSRRDGGGLRLLLLSAMALAASAWSGCTQRQEHPTGTAVSGAPKPPPPAAVERGDEADGGEPLDCNPNVPHPRGTDFPEDDFRWGWSCTFLYAHRITDRTRAALARLGPASQAGVYLMPSSIAGYETIRDTPGVSMLEIFGPHVEGLEAIATLRDLRDLRLRGARMKTLKPLGSLTQLESLSIQDCEALEDKSLAPLRAMRRLRVVYISDGCAIADISPLRDLQSLREVMLHRTSVTDLDPLRKLPGLESLRLEGTRIGSLKPIAELTTLTHLDLRDTGVSDVSALSRLTRLKELWVSEGVNMTGVEAMKRANPGLDVTVYPR